MSAFAKLGCEQLHQVGCGTESHQGVGDRIAEGARELLDSGTTTFRATSLRADDRTALG